MSAKQNYRVNLDELYPHISSIKATSGGTRHDVYELSVKDVAAYDAAQRHFLAMRKRLFDEMRRQGYR